MLVRARRLVGPIQAVIQTMTLALALTVTAATGGLTLSVVSPAVAQAADRTITGVVNTYQAVAQIDVRATTTLILAGSPSGASTPFATGDRVLVVQMTGANPAAGPSNLGVYEQARLSAVAGSGAGARLSLTAPLKRDFAPGTERVQVVRMAGGDGSTALGGTVTALPWNGRTGGVVAIAADVLDLSGQLVDASGDGFTTSNGASTTVLAGPDIAAGSSTGRGSDGSAPFGGAGRGGGGFEGAGGAGGNASAASNAGGARGGGAEPGRATAVGTSGGRGAGPGLVALAAGGSGGGGGILGGGGGGGGGDLALPAPGGGGGVSGGGGGGSGTLGGALAAVSRAGGGGGGVGSVGNGADGLPGSVALGYGSAGGGGGSYGGGGASGGLAGPISPGGGGGGGGSWTGGGGGGVGGAIRKPSVGGSGNAVVAGTPVPRHYLTGTDPRLMLGGAGGRGSADAGALPGAAGGGIVLLDVGRLSGTGTVQSNGAAGAMPSSGVHSGSGGGGGGQITISGRLSDATVQVQADGGAGGRPSVRSLVGSGASGGGGGGGGVSLDLVGATEGCGRSSTVPELATSVAGGDSPRVTNPVGGALTVGGGSGGSGLVCTSALVRAGIGDRVWRDANADGVQDPDERGLAGVGVRLLDATGAVLAQTSTDADGRYRFADLSAGVYRVDFSPPEGCTLTRSGADSDVDPFDGLSDLIELGAATADVDAGLVCTTSSAAALGAFSQGRLADLQPGDPGPFDGASGTAVLSADTSSSSLLLKITGLPAGSSGQTFGAQLHFGPCAEGDPDAVGPAYNTSLLDGDDPVVISPQTEAWLDVRIDGGGRAISSVTVPFLPSAADRSIVITSEPTDPVSGEAGTRLACLPLVIF